MKPHVTKQTVYFKDILMRHFVYGLTLLLSTLGCSVEKNSSPGTEGTLEVSTPVVDSKAGVLPMVSIPAGEFIMGDDRGEFDEAPAYTVRIDAFMMDAYEVTQTSYTALMGTNTSKHKNPKQPVEQLGWFAAIKYCNLRSQREGLTPCYNLETIECDYSANGYRLPTEAEWEYACRAGSTTAYSFGDSDASLKEHGWYEVNSAKSPQPVGKKKPNAWGLYDMHGNVSEWCNDIYNDDFYGKSSSDNPKNDGAGDERVLRGGNWDSDEGMCRSSARFSEAPGLADVCFGYDAYGFRCVRLLTDGEATLQ
jgi:formylglycine-generating enzyme